MPYRETTTVEGEITEVSARRIVVRTANGTAVADLGPTPAGDAEPEKDDTAGPTGERKPSHDVKWNPAATAAD